MPKPIPRWAKILIAYYGLLQSLHLLVLIHAGARLLIQSRAVFPVLPPPGGWDEQTLPFLVALGITDSVGILLGMIFTARYFTKQRFHRRLGVISLTIFITGAIPFAIGTIVSGAWAAYPLAYGSMAILFIPSPILYYWLLTSNLTRKATAQRS